jgi:integrase/recombinase XerD
MYMRDNDLSYSSINGRLAVIISFLDLNDVIVNHKKINRFVGEHVKTIRDEAYTHADLDKMFEYASFRIKLIISIYSSTGIRKDAILSLRLKHLEKIDSHGIYKFTIYENTKEEYITFCTPECANFVDDYLEQRKKAGEKITDESYLLRNDFNYLSPEKVRKPKPMTITGITHVIEFLLRKIEVHTTNHKTENYKYQRHKKASFHAFRKYFNTCLANCDVNVTIKEMLMGHSVGLDDAYYKPTENQLLAEYSKAMNELTINEENRLKKQVNELQKKQDKVDRLIDRIDSLEKQLNIV